MPGPVFPENPFEGLPTDPGARNPRAGMSVERRVAALEERLRAMGGIVLPPSSTSNGSVLTSDTSQTGGVKWAKASLTAVTYSGTWASFGGGEPGLKYALLPGGLVVLNGLVKRTGTSGTTIAVLPSGFRPAENGIFWALDLSAFPHPNARINIDTSGNIVIANEPGTAITAYSLAGICFVAA